MVYNIKKSEELFKLKLSVVCAHGIETHSEVGWVKREFSVTLFFLEVKMDKELDNIVSFKFIYFLDSRK